jgi:poly-beta-1,6-N-acetyl-D-glucosamine biosynthesis protein PgaD
MKSSQLPIQWPPIIKSHSVPLIIKLRDDLITVLAWIVLITVLHDLWWLLYDYLSDPIFELTKQEAPNWDLIWQKMSRFVYRAGILMCWIIWFGSTRYALKMKAGIIAQPREVNPEELATLYGHAPSEIKHWQNLRSVKVYLNERNGIETIVRNEYS